MAFINKKVSLKTKFMFLFIAVGTGPLLISNYLSYKDSRELVIEQGTERIDAEGRDIAHEIAYYFEREKGSLLDLADQPLVTRGVVKASKLLEAYASEKLSKKQENDLEVFYNTVFGKKYRDTNPGVSFAAKSVLGKMDKVAKLAQWDYIVDNPHPLGEKHNLDRSGRDLGYSELHEELHEVLRPYLDKHGLYDLFLIAPDGRLVYSVFKETDFATNLLSGPWAGSGIARAFEKSRNLSPGQTYMDDFDNYTPSYEAPASFLSTPLHSKGEYVGSMIIQFPLDRISAIAGVRDGLGELGQTLLIGLDGRLRADAFRQKDTYSVANSFSKENNVSLWTEALKAAKETQKASVMEQVSYDGTETLAYYTSLDILGNKWLLSVELAESELFAGLNAFTKVLMWIIVASIGVVALVAWTFGSSIGGQLQQIILKLSQTSLNVAGASQASAESSTELSEATTEQAASLQETMASIEEISAMVNQNAESATKAQESVASNAKASQQGNESVQEMIGAIGEIKKTNDEILDQMQSSNTEFGAIVKIISEIGEKTKVINDIVFQTKLLSFNASVEAARAGEHGKGFAVVAEEVGNLAQMSGNAASEISTMLTNSIQRVNEIVEKTTKKVDQLVEVGKDKVSLGQSTAEKCREALANIAVNAKQVEGMVAEIANASKEQAQGVQEINKAISQLDQVTQQNTAVAQNGSVQAEQLSSESRELRGAVSLLELMVSGAVSHHEEFDSGVSKNNVIKMETFQSPERRTPSIKEHQYSKSQGLSKKAVGSDYVPSSDDSEFEDF